MPSNNVPTLTQNTTPQTSSIPILGNTQGSITSQVPCMSNTPNLTYANESYTPPNVIMVCDSMDGKLQNK